jgi:hypothetical protein
VTVDHETTGKLVGLAWCLGIPLLAALFVGIAIAGWWRTRKRAQEMAAFAARIGFQFVGHDQGIVVRLSGYFTDFARGHSRQGLNVCWGNMGFGGVRASVVLGDYRYKVTRGGGKSRSTRTYEFSFISLVPVLAIGEELSVRRERLLDRIGAFVGLDDIDFESSEFSKRFHVKCSDRRFAYDLFDPRMIEFFLAAPPPELEACGGIVVIDDASIRWTVEGFQERLAWLDGFFARIPRHIRAERLPPAERAWDPVLNPEGHSGQKGVP